MKPRKPGPLPPLLFALLQELGACGLGSKCYWAHGTDDLDTKAFSFDFPLVNANRQPGEWDRVGKKPLAVKTGKGKQAAWQGASTSAWGPAQHHRSAPSHYLFLPSEYLFCKNIVAVLVIIAVVLVTVVVLVMIVVNTVPQPEI